MACDETDKALSASKNGLCHGFYSQNTAKNGRDNDSNQFNVIRKELFPQTTNVTFQGSRGLWKKNGEPKMFNDEN